MATGLGARKTNDDAKSFVAAEHADYRSGGVSAGPVMVRFPGFPSPDSGSNLDSTALLVWVITGTAIAVVLGIHFSFGGHRLL